MSQDPPNGAGKTRVTQGDIARAAGVHPTTVSLALRHGPGLPEETRRRIQAMAERMGYCPDPMLRALVEYRKARPPRRQQRTLAYVTNWTTRPGGRASPSLESRHAGAQRRAAQLGYDLEEFRLGEPGMSRSRLDRVLADRDVSGVILATHPAGSGDLAGFDWARFSAVAIGRFPRLPALHRVTDDHAGAMRLALRQVRAAGYERIGLVLPAWWDDLTDQAWSTGFLADQGRQAVHQRVPILSYESRGEEPAPGGLWRRADDRSPLAAWYDQYRPEVVLACSPDIGAQLGELGLFIPEDVAYVDLDLGGHDRGRAGIRHHGARVGEIAVETVVGLLQQNLRGIPAVPTVTSVEGTWVDGETLPARRPAAAAPAARAAIAPEPVLA